jgi:Reverse transcriptase (RNA-dependent DNA polymerase)
VKIVIGDLNAQVGREEIFRPTIGRFSLHRESNENGLKLINFAAAHKMVISSTVFQRKNIHKATWFSPGSRTKSQIDHVLIDGRHASDVLNVRTYRCVASDIDHHSSDHLLLGATIKSRISNVYTNRGTKCRRLDIAALQVPGKRKEFREKLDQKLSDQGEEATAWTEVRNAMNQVAEEVLGFQTPVRNEWFDDECRSAVQAVIEARAEGRDTRSKMDKVRALQKEKKKLLKKKKRQFDQQRIADIENLHTQNETRKFYQAIRIAKNGFQPRISMCRKKNGELVCDLNGVLERWKEHFNELLNAGTDDRQAAQSRHSYESDDGKEFSEPSRQEVVDAISRLKNNKAPGDDALSGELFKAGSASLVDTLHELILRCWSDEKLPSEWKTGVICPIFKKGCKLECANYRGISLLPSAYKIFSNILADRLQPLMEDFLHPYQAGFRRGMSTTDQIFCIRQIIQKSYEMNTETDHLFIDFKQAYDTIDREQLWGIMAEFGFPHKLVRLLKATLEGVVCSVKIEGHLSGAFESEVGLRQGDGISTMLFNIALEGVVRRSGIEKSGTVFTKSVQMLGFADDIDIIGRNIRSVTDAYSKLEKEANKIGLHVNEDKTKFLMICPSQRTRDIVGSHLEIGDKRFEVVKEFTYLGVQVNDRYDTSIEVRRRITSAQRAFYGIKHLLRSKNISRKAKFAMYKTLIRPVAIYGSESWNLTEEDERQLGVFERKVLRTIIGPKKIADDHYRIRYNHELYEFFQEPHIAATVKHRRLSWAGHVVRRGVDQPVYQTFNGMFRDGSRTRGRPKSSWEKAVNEDSAAFGLPNWQKEAKDRPKFRNFLDSVKARTRAERPVK